MERLVRYGLMFCAIALVVAMVVYGLRESNKPKETARQAASSKSANDSVQHRVLSFNLEGLTEKGAKKWDVKGESAEAISENEVKLNRIVAKAYGEDAEATITADKGVYNKSKNNVTLEQNVKATIINTQGMDGSLADFTLNPLNATEPKEPNPDKKKTKTVITCDGEVQFNYENNQAFFTKNVKVVNDDGIIDADKITVNLDPVTRKIKEIVAEGNVKITRGENVTYSEKATYFESEKKVLLEGRPKIIITQEGNFETNFLNK